MNFGLILVWLSDYLKIEQFHSKTPEVENKQYLLNDIYRLCDSGKFCIYRRPRWIAAAIVGRCNTLLLIG